MPQQRKQQRPANQTTVQRRAQVDTNKVTIVKGDKAKIATPAPIPTTAQPNRSGLGDLAKANKAAKAARTAPPATSNDATVAAQKAKEKKNR